MRRRRRNPEWTGTEKQIEWAKRIRAYAEPIIRDWIAANAAADAEDHQYRLRGGRHRSRLNWRTPSANNMLLRQALQVEDARFWIDNRDCGTQQEFLAAFARLQRHNPCRRNPGAGVHGSLLGLGTLASLEVESGGRTKTIKTPGRWLAWEPKAKRYHICMPKQQLTDVAGLSPAIRSAHRRFHSEVAQKSLVADVPTPQGKLKPLGLLKSLVYRVPSRMVLSPEKNPYAWHHAFGDTGHRGGATYPDRLKPQLCRDDAGNLFICRRRGNIFTVDTWLRG